MESVIVRVPTGKSNSYLVRANRGFILVDAGMPGKAKNVQHALKKFNASFSDIKLIVVTHVHYDHVGSLYDIKEKSKALVLVHEKELQHLVKGFTSFPKGTNFISKAISCTANKFFPSKNQFTPVGADIVLRDNFKLKDYGVDGKIIHTPGHTEGSVCIIIDNYYCITGDTLFNLLPNSVYPPFANNKDKLLESWKKLERYNCLKYYPGHGRDFDRDKFNKALKKRLR